jgi:hypothetical protein
MGVNQNLLGRKMMDVFNWGGCEGQNLHNTKGNRKKILQEGKPKLAHIVGVNTY